MDGQNEEEETKKPRKEVVKKTRVERPPPPPKPQSPPRLPSPPVVKKRSPPPPTPSPPRSPTPPRESPEITIDIPDMPELPELQDKEPRKKKEKQKFALDAPPALAEEKKKLKGPPKVRLLPKVLSRPRKSRPAHAPVTSNEVLDAQDPLDFLAKYCIINPDRLPFYEIIFEGTVAEQEPKYKKPEPIPEKSDKNSKREIGDEPKEGEKKKKGKSKKKKSTKEKSKEPEINPSLIPTQRGMNVEKVALTLEEQHVEKMLYTLETLHDRMLECGASLEALEAERIHILADKAREWFPEVASPDYFPKVKKGKKGKKSKNEEPPRKLKPNEITADVIVGRLDDKMLASLTNEPSMKQLEAEIDRLKDKIIEIQNRVEQIASEKLLADAFCMNQFFLRQGLDTGPTKDPKEGFKRQQSELYNRLHPNPDFEMNLDEVEYALQQINNHLITDKEFFFLYNILNLPGRKTINFRLFTIIAALSEKVSQLDPVIRKMINNFNYNALDIKMEKCKELFSLLEGQDMPRGGAQASSLAVELTAGGLRPEHTNYVLHKFNRENSGVIDFLDFVTYVPLFVEIHRRIIQHPLSDKCDL